MKRERRPAQVRQVVRGSPSPAPNPAAEPLTGRRRRRHDDEREQRQRVGKSRIELHLAADQGAICTVIRLTSDPSGSKRRIGAESVGEEKKEAAEEGRREIGSATSSSTGIGSAGRLWRPRPTRAAAEKAGMMRRISSGS